MQDYLDKSAKSMFAVCLTFDSARAAEKMTDFSCTGANNIAWKEGPYLTAGADQKEIDRTRPYVIKTSLEFGVAAGIVMGSNPKKAENGGVAMPLPPMGANRSRVEPVISKLAIIEQFELFKDFLKTFDGPVNKKKCKEWEGRADKSLLELVTELTDRRNSLTHDSDHQLPSMKEAVEYFYSLRQLAPKLYEIQQLHK